MNFSVGSWCFLMNCQSIQEMSASESTSAEELMTFNMCERVINWTGILIDLFEVDTSTGVHIIREGEFYIEVSLLFKNSFLTWRKSKLLLHFYYCLLFFEFWEFLFFMSMLDMGFLGWFRRTGASECHVSTFSALETGPFLAHCSCSSRVSFESLTMSTSITLGSFVLRE